MGAYELNKVLSVCSTSGVDCDLQYKLSMTTGELSLTRLFATNSAVYKGSAGCEVSTWVLPLEKAPATVSAMTNCSRHGRNGRGRARVRL